MHFLFVQRKKNEFENLGEFFMLLIKNKDGRLKDHIGVEKF